jgi:hypothetical protein
MRPSFFAGWPTPRRWIWKWRKKNYIGLKMGVRIFMIDFGEVLWPARKRRDPLVLQEVSFDHCSVVTR